MIIGKVSGYMLDNDSTEICVAYNNVTAAYDFCIEGTIKSITAQSFVLSKQYNTVPYGPLIDMYLNTDLTVDGIQRKVYPKPQAEVPKTTQELIKPISTIYLDMDEVLVDFKYALVKCNPEYDVAKMYDIAPIFGNKEALIHTWIANTIKQNGFATAEPLGFYNKVMDQLLPFWKSKGIEVEILSSLTSNPAIQSQIATQKLRWLTNNNCSIKFNFVKGAKNKQSFAKPGALLIDDYHKNVTQFIAAGGYAILADPENQQDSIYEKLRLIGLTPD